MDAVDDVLPLIESSVEIAADPVRVWALVSDLPRLAQWSPQVVKSVVRGGGGVQQGVRLFNINRRGLLVWPTRSRVTVFEPHRRIAFRVEENFSVWSFELEPTDTGTRLTQRRETPDGLSGLSLKLTERFFGGQQNFGEELAQGMRRTLERVKVEAER